MQEVLVIGEALVDIVAAPGQPALEHVGGSPANVALGLARLGIGTRLLTRIGDDERGRLVRRHLESSGCRLADGSVTPGATSTATAHLDENGVASYEFDLQWILPANAVVGEARALHTGSIAATLAPGGDDVVRLIESAVGRSLISYDPNARPALMGDPRTALERIERIVRSADVVKVSDEDLAWLHPGVAPAEIAEEWSRSGPSLVVVTHGGEGAFASTSAGARISVAAPKVQVADTVGAGDSFMGGLIDGLWSAGLLGADRRQALADVDAATVEGVLERCARIAAITVSRAGANPPRSSELV